MGKRSVIKQQASSKISKKDHRHHGPRQHHHHPQAEFNSLINDLKPKVYITDPSSFKQLVQDLTGNNNIANPNLSSITSSSSKLLHHDQHDQVHQFSVEPSVSTEAPTTTTTSSEELCHNDNNNNMMNDTDELVMIYREDHEEDLDGFFCRISEEKDTVFEDILACDYDQINYLESLLFDDDDDHQQVVVDEQSLITDPFYSQIIQPAEISDYDYDFSGLIN